ncbi:MAG: glutamate 5-kinase [Actinobacteria bacterium]|nr:glutamate 5-kinase [Actinomycetota bacterium]
MKQEDNKNGSLRRKEYLINIKRIVIKVGSSSLTSPRGGLDFENIRKLTNEVSGLRSGGMEFLIVTSGAMAAGLKYLGISEKPGEVPGISILQAAAAVGQVELMTVYRDMFLKKGIKIGQILLTHEDTTMREQYLNIKNTIKNLLEMGVIPVINENDSVAVDEIKFGDNDELAAMTSVLSEADLLIILTDIEGFYDRDPRIYPDARLVPFIEKIDDKVENAAGGIGSAYGIGGMHSKIKAAKICSFAGIPMAIASSRKKDVLKDIISGSDTGTLFAPCTHKKVKGFKKWIAFGIRTRGNIIIDRGAEEAVVKKGKSVLPVGILKVEGDFKRGETLRVLSMEGKLIAKGISNFSSEDIRLLKGKNKKKIADEYGAGHYCEEVIHRDCLVVFLD